MASTTPTKRHTHQARYEQRTQLQRNAAGCLHWRIRKGGTTPHQLSPNDAVAAAQLWLFISTIFVFLRRSFWLFFVGQLIYIFWGYTSLFSVAPRYRYYRSLRRSSHKLKGHAATFPFRRPSPAAAPRAPDSCLLLPDGRPPYSTPNPTSLPFFELHSWLEMTTQHSMFGLAVSMLLSDNILGSDNWLSQAPDPRPDQLPNPVRSLQAICQNFSFSNLQFVSFSFFEKPIFQSFTPTSRTTYVGILMNQRNTLCMAPIHAARPFNPIPSGFLIRALVCTQQFHYLKNRETCINGLIRCLLDFYMTHARFLTLRPGP